MTNSVKLRLPEVVVPGKRLGRNIGHDPRSLAYLVPETSTPATVQWDARISILDQGDLGSCTGNATTGELGTEPFYDDWYAAGNRVDLDEAFAVKLYSLATQLDGFPGTYKPTDTGSDGLSAAKAAQKLGLASGYVHATSLAGLHNMIQSGPFAIGVSWYSDMDEPNSQGVVKVGGTVRGGHELCVVGYDSSSNLWRIRNSWSDSWAKDGYCYWSDDDMAKLLAEQGDATQLVPITQPAPTPTPVPTGSAVTFTDAQKAALDTWAAGKLYAGTAKAKAAWKAATAQ